jgi:hypothetical protein
MEITALYVGCGISRWNVEGNTQHTLVVMDVAAMNTQLEHAYLNFEITCQLL